MAKLKLDKESLQGFFFNHTEKIVLAVVLLLLVLFVWTGSSLEGIAKSPPELKSKVDLAADHLEVDSWDSIKQEYPLKLDHFVRKEDGDAPTSESYYRLDTPLIGGVPNSATPRQDPQLFAVTDLEATVVTAALAFKANPKLTDPFADLENMEQKKVEAPKKRRKPKKRTGAAGGMYGSGMESMYGEGMDEGGEDSMYGSGMEGMYGEGAMASETGAGPIVRADENKFHGYRPTATPTATGSSVIGRSANIVSVRALVPYQQQWDEFERVFSDAAGYVPSRDIPRYLSFRAQRAEVPNDPDQPLKWGYIAWTERVRDTLPLMGLAGIPGELADAKFCSNVLTMPVPPLMMHDLRGLVLHSKVPLQEEAKKDTVQTAAPELVEMDQIGGVADIDELPTVPGARSPGAGATGSGMYGAGGAGMYGGGGEGMYGSGGEGMYGSGGDGMYGGGMGMGSSQLVRGPQAEFLMVRFFDYIQPGKKYVYRIQVVLEDPNHPANPQAQPQDRILADTVRTRLAKVAADEAKQSEAKKTPVRLSIVMSEWSEPTAPVSVELKSETYAGAVSQPRMLDISRGSDPSAGKSGYAVAVEGEPIAEVLDLTWNSKYAIDLPGIVKASRGALFWKRIEANVIDPVTLVYKTIPDHALTSGELVVDIRGGEALDSTTGDKQPLLSPGEVAVIDASGNFIVRNELDDWQIFDKYAPPPPIVVEPAPAASGNEAAMEMGESYNPYGE